MSKTIPTIRELRERARLSPLEVEQQTHGLIKRGNLSAIEQGKSRNPGFSMVTALAQVLGVEPAVCFQAISASCAARATRTAPGKPGRPKSTYDKDPAPVGVPVLTAAQALEQARALCAALEVLAAREVA